MGPVGNAVLPTLCALLLHICQGGVDFLSSSSDSDVPLLVRDFITGEGGGSMYIYILLFAPTYLSEWAMYFYCMPPFPLFFSFIYVPRSLAVTSISARSVTLRRKKIQGTRILGPWTCGDLGAWCGRYTMGPWCVLSNLQRQERSQRPCCLIMHNL